MKPRPKTNKPKSSPPENLQRPNLKRPKVILPNISALPPENLQITILQRPKVILPNMSGLPEIGSSSFIDLRENGAIIDKSEFIYEFIENPGSFIAVFFQGDLEKAQIWI